MQEETTVSNPSEGSNGGIQRMQHLHGRTYGPTRRSTKGQWTAEEDEILRKAVQRFKGKNWKKIAECFKDRTDVQCLHRWQKVLNPELVKGPWSKEEDEIIIELVHKYGPKKWSTIAQHLPGRIGKQCRERWHNHLNPAINKEAWTQEEELILIRAHQMYGNRWAELTKFLPGRSDNAIKNHWNSSVKKKLDSYLASGVLDQLQALPLIEHQNKSMPSSSSRVQSSGDESDAKGGLQIEEAECSQSSSAVGCSKSASEMPNEFGHMREQFQQTDGCCGEEQQVSIETYHPNQYYPSFEDVMFPIPDIHCEVENSNFPDQNFSHDDGTSATQDYQLNVQNLQNVASVELAPDTSGFPTHCVDTNSSNQVIDAAFGASMSYGASMANPGAGCHEPSRVLISDEECCRALFPQAYDSSGNSEQKPNMIEMGEGRTCLVGQNSDIHASQTEAHLALLPTFSTSDASGIFCGQTYLPFLFATEDNALVNSKELDQLNHQLFGVQEPGSQANADDGFIFSNSACRPCDNDCSSKLGLQEQLCLQKNSLKSEPVNSSASQPEVTQGSPFHRQPIMQIEQGTGALCYEPPRFPSLDIPFLSCDLMQSNNDLQQEYSPLGIRQLMMSSMNCMTPCRLWDSPSRERSPAAVLKGAAKTFAGTPSILKKRHRDLLSPLSERRDKKLGKDITSTLAKDFSRLDVMLGGSGNQKPVSLSPAAEHRYNSGTSFNEDKENLGHASAAAHQSNDTGHTSFLKDKVPEKPSHCSCSQGKTQPVSSQMDMNTKVGAVATTGIEQESSKFLAEHDINDLLLFSPDQIGPKADKTQILAAQTPGNHCRNLEATSKDNATSDACTENLGIFSGTPFRRSLESPSAFKSPWFFNSLPGSRFDTDITVEDMGYLMSPGDRSYDALGLMKQLSERTKGAYADALEVLGNDTPETIVKKRQLRLSSQRKENCSRSPASNVMSERRTLDFSDCGTPGKGREGKKSSTSMSISSPSSYLLKSFR